MGKGLPKVAVLGDCGVSSPKHLSLLTGVGEMLRSKWSCCRTLEMPPLMMMMMMMIMMKREGASYLMYKYLGLS